MSKRAKQIIAEAEAARANRTLAGALADRVAELERQAADDAGWQERLLASEETNQGLLQRIAKLEQEIADAHESLNDLGAPDSKWLDGKPTDLAFRICEYASTPVEATDEEIGEEALRAGYWKMLELAHVEPSFYSFEQGVRAALQEGE